MSVPDHKHLVVKVHGSCTTLNEISGSIRHRGKTFTLSTRVLSNLYNDFEDQNHRDFGHGVRNMKYVDFHKGWPLIVKTEQL